MSRRLRNPAVSYAAGGALAAALATATGAAVYEILKRFDLAQERKRRPALPQLNLCGSPLWHRGYAAHQVTLSDGRPWWILYNGRGERIADGPLSGSLFAHAADVVGRIMNEPPEQPAVHPIAQRHWHDTLTGPKEAVLRVWGHGVIPPEVQIALCSSPDHNQVWASPDCSLVVEGAFFEPYSLGLPITAIEAPTLTEVLAADPENSVYGLIDFLINELGIDDARSLAQLVAAEVGCPPDSPWTRSLMSRISLYVEEAGGIPFHPEPDDVT